MLLVADNETFSNSKGWLILSPHYHRLEEGQLRPINLPLRIFLQVALKYRNLPTAWLAGATKAEAAATRREKRKKVRILIVLLDKVVVNGLCVMVSEEHKRRS
jgi:hypothetical protein